MWHETIKELPPNKKIVYLSDSVTVSKPIMGYHDNILNRWFDWDGNLIKSPLYWKLI